MPSGFALIRRFKSSRSISAEMTAIRKWWAFSLARSLNLRAKYSSCSLFPAIPTEPTM